MKEVQKVNEALGLVPGSRVVLKGDETLRSCTLKEYEDGYAGGTVAAVVEIVPGLCYVVNADRLAVDDDTLRGLVATSEAVLRTSDRVKVEQLTNRHDLPAYVRKRWELTVDGLHVDTYKTKKAALGAGVLAVAVVEWRALAGARVAAVEVAS